MRYPPQHLLKTRERIVHSARRLFAERGFDGVSIDAVMADAGLTRGAFYRHFTRKADLYKVALAAAGQAPVPTAAHAEGARCAADGGMDDRLQAWLTDGRLALLASDACSASADVRATARRRFDALVDEIRHSVEDVAEAPEATLAATALIVGALALAQAQRDDATRQRLLHAALRGARALVVPRPAAADPPYFWSAPESPRQGLGALPGPGAH